MWQLFHRGIEKTLLENAVPSVKSLRAVKDQAHQLHMHTGKVLCYDQCATLILSAKTWHDSNVLSESAKISIKVYHTKLGGSDFETDSPFKVT